MDASMGGLRVHAIPPRGASGPPLLLRKLREITEVHVHSEGVVVVYLRHELCTST